MLQQLLLNNVIYHLKNKSLFPMLDLSVIWEKVKRNGALRAILIPPTKDAPEVKDILLCFSKLYLTGDFKQFGER